MTTEASKSFDRPFLATTNIVASNDINEDSLHSLTDQVGFFFVGCSLILRSLMRDLYFECFSAVAAMVVFVSQET